MKKTVFLLALCVLLSTVISADWISFTGERNAEVQKVVKSDLGDVIRFDIVLPGVQVDEKIVDGKTYKTISVNGSSDLLKKGYPELKAVSAFIAIPFSNDISIEIVDSEKEVINDVRLISSKGNITRNIDPENVPYTWNEEVYGNDVDYPAYSNLVSVSSPFIMRDISGIRAQIIPFQYNDAQNTLTVYKKISVRVSVNGYRNLSPRVAYNESEAFENIYSNIFLNYKSPLINKDEYQAPDLSNNLLVIAYDEFYAETEKLVQWKRQIGFDVDFKKLSEIGSDSDSIKAYIQQKFDAGELTHVIFVGDIEHIPCIKGKNERADSDNMYVKLAGADNVPDAFISRISVKNNEQLNAIIAKTIRYEKEPEAGAAWYKKALAIASNQGSPDDWKRAEELNAALENDLGFTDIARCYDPEYSNSHGYNSNKSVIFDAVNEGLTMINYIGHGSATQWVTSGFNTSDAKNVDNGMMLPVIWSVACVNGKLSLDECFAEAWLRSGDANGGGTIGMAAASTNMAWVPPCVWQKEIVNEQYCQKLHETADVANLYGMLKTLEEYGVSDSGYGNQLVEQVIYFGDGTVKVRTSAPRQVNAEAVRVDGKILVSVDADTKAIADGIVVTAYDGNDKYETARVDSRGYAEIEDNGQTHVTVYSHEIVPVIDLEIK